MKNIKSFFPALSLVFALLAASVSIYLLSTRPKTAYVNLSQLYNDFDLKKKLETQLTSVQQLRQQTLDSLELGLKILSRNIQNMDVQKQKEEIHVKTVEFENRRQEYVIKKKSFEEDNTTLTEQYSSQIWKQLNQYVKDFGEAHNYTYIMGGDGTGTMMYASQGEDLTQTLLSYANSRYKGDPQN